MAATPSWDFARGPFGVLMVVEMAEARGISAVSALASTGLARSELTRPDLRVAATQELAVIRNVVRGLGGPDYTDAAARGESLELVLSTESGRDLPVRLDVLGCLPITVNDANDNLNG